MTVLRSKQNPASRTEVGAHVLDAAKSIDTRSIKARLAAFVSVHRAFVGADDKVAIADAVARKEQQVLGDLDVDQDQAVDALATALAGEASAAAASRLEKAASAVFARKKPPHLARIMLEKKPELGSDLLKLLREQLAEPRS